ncbi:hypothetical protein ACLMAJ_09085 [Nocardia sp. KC 131]|uniref:hypothetical protein n=1 Tax=Nocardia arseniciresistens TaxID=3392119 RepID=UPI00398F02FB
MSVEGHNKLLGREQAMPNMQLPQRNTVVGPPAAYVGATVDVVETFATALREWAGQPMVAESSRNRGVVATESSRCRGVESSGIGRTNDETARLEGGL